MSARKKDRGIYKFNMALVSWHYRLGYIFEFSNPKDFEIPKKHLEPLFFYALNIKQRRVETQLNMIYIDGVSYHFFYYGAFWDKPAMLVVNSNYRYVRPILYGFSALVSWNKRRAAEFLLNSADLSGVINKIRNDRMVVFLLLMAFGANDLIIKELIRNQKITLGELLDLTSDYENPPTRMEILNLVRTLTWCGLTEISFSKNSLDFKIRLKRVPVLLIGKRSELEPKRDTEDNLIAQMEAIHHISLILASKELRRLICEGIEIGSDALKDVGSILINSLEFLEDKGLIIEKEGKIMPVKPFSIGIMDLKTNKIINEIEIC